MMRFMIVPPLRYRETYEAIRPRATIGSHQFGDLGPDRDQSSVPRWEPLERSPQDGIRHHARLGRGRSTRSATGAVWVRIAAPRPEPVRDTSQVERRVDTQHVAGVGPRHHEVAPRL